MPARLGQLEPPPDLVDRAYRALLAAIGDGSLAPGARLTQEEIAGQLKVSRQPVLQALRLLKKDGLVLDAPGRGVQVAPLDARLLGQVYEVRGALDALAARLAARRRAVLDPALIVRGRKAATGRSVPALIDADLAFHEALYDAGGNALLAQSARLHWHQLRRAMGQSLRISTLRDTVWDEHAAIAAAVAAGDEARAGRLALAHCERAGHDMTQRLLHSTDPQGDPR